MAAAPAGDLTPLATPDLPAVNRNKGPKTSPVLPAMAAAGWSSLPGDLVRRISDSFLASNDLDRYMCFRSVCPSWRAATDDPTESTSDTRFYPRTWIILDNVLKRDDDELLLLNTDTGRFLRKKLPLLHEYYVVATAPGGFFVLADRSPPHAARLFNPLTAVLTRFMAPVPPDASVAYVGCHEDALLDILLFSDSSRKICKAISDSKAFTANDYPEELYNFLRKAILGGAAAHSYLSGSAIAGVVVELFNVLTSLHLDPVSLFSFDYPGDANSIRCSVVGLASDMLLVMEIYGATMVFKVNTETGNIEAVQNISRFAIFIGHHRSLAVDTDNFPGIEANCMYYTEHSGSSARICKYNLEEGKEEIISEAAEFLKQEKRFVLVADRPFTIIHLLCSYTINIPDSQLALQQML